MTKTVMFVYGTRPEAIKIAPLVRALEDTAGLRSHLVSTGQHREMLAQVNDLFGLVPDRDFALMTHGATVNALYRRVLKRAEEVLRKDPPDALVVQGDTASASAAALAGFLAGVPVVHLEAGLRTHDLHSPFPEEANRRIVAVVADLHLAPTAGARANLEREGVDPERILVTGNTVVDALQWTVAQRTAPPAGLAEAEAPGSRLILVTTHRRESWGPRMAEAMAAVADVAAARPDVQVVLPVHSNPVVRETVAGALDGLPNVHLVEPLGYAEFAYLLDRCHLVVTDSGGVQEEAPSLGKPVLVLRDDTERPEGVAAGTVRLVGTRRSTVRREIERLLDDDAAYRAMANAVNPYGDGKAADRCARAISALLLDTPAPDEFLP